MGLNVGILAQSTAFPIGGSPAASFSFSTTSGVPTRTDVPVSTMPPVSLKNKPPAPTLLMLSTHL